MREHTFSPDQAGTEKLVQALRDNGAKLDAVFWAKVSELGEWRLYISSPDFETAPRKQTLRRIQNILKTNKDMRISLFDIELRSNQSRDIYELAQFLTPMFAGNVGDTKIEDVQVDGKILESARILFFDKDKILGDHIK